jgi:hypothetical protein
MQRKMMALSAFSPTDQDRESWLGLMGHLSYAEIERVLTRAAKSVVMNGMSISSAIAMALIAEKHRAS